MPPKGVIMLAHKLPRGQQATVPDAKSESALARVIQIDILKYGHMLFPIVDNSQPHLYLGKSSQCWYFHGKTSLIWFLVETNAAKPDCDKCKILNKVLLIMVKWSRIMYLPTYFFLSLIVNRIGKQIRVHRNQIVSNP